MAQFNHYSLFTYWGKASREDDSWHPLVCHSLDVARVAVSLLAAWTGLCGTLEHLLGLSQRSIFSLVGFLTVLHDIGKFSIRFQAKRPDLLKSLQNRTHPKKNILHADAGLSLWVEKGVGEAINNQWGNLEPGGWEYCVTELVSASIGHHGVPADISRGSSHFFDSMEVGNGDMEAALSFVKWAADKFLSGVDLAGISDHAHCKKASWLVAGLTVAADWIASQHMPYLGGETLDLDAYWDTIENSAIQAVRGRGLFPLKVDPRSNFSTLFPELAKPTALQELADTITLDHSPQLFILESQTGSGKTEAAIRLAQRLMGAGQADGFYFALPTMATANGVYERISGFYKNLFFGGAEPGVMLVHSARDLNPQFLQTFQSLKFRSDIQDEEESILREGWAWIADRRKLAFMAQVGVGTVDQALLSVLPVRHQSLSLLALSQRVLIVDEVHAYDVFTSKLIGELLRFHAALGGSAILLSATLPRGIKEELAQCYLEASGKKENVPITLESPNYPLLTHVRRSAPAEEIQFSDIVIHAPSKTVRVNLHRNIGEVFDRIYRAAEAGQAVAWVRNSVDDVVDAYKELLAKGLDPTRTHLFHARMALGDRMEREEQVKRWFGKKSSAADRRGRVLVASQVIEQSLDLDFDRMFTDLAPIDLLLQRAGRLHRHRRDENGQLLEDHRATDARSTEAELNVLAPPALEDANAGWYSDMFPRGAWVYDRHDLLWLTARLLEREGQWNPATDPRRLVEAVYGENQTGQVPAALKDAIVRSVNKQKNVASQARQQALKLNAGYGGNISAHWGKPEFRETRLGLPTLRLRLAVWEGGELKPLCPWPNTPPQPWALWELSQINLPAWRFEHLLSEQQNDPFLPTIESSDLTLQSACRNAASKLPDKGRLALFLPLIPADEGRFKAQITTSKGDGHILSYTRDKGMEFLGE